MINMETNPYMDDISALNTIYGVQETDVSVFKSYIKTTYLMESDATPDIVMESVGDIFKTIVDGIKKFIEKIKEFFKKVLAYITTAFEDLNVVADKVKPIVEKMDDINFKINGYKFTVLEKAGPNMDEFNSIISKYHSDIEDLTKIKSSEFKRDYIKWSSDKNLGTLRGQVLGINSYIDDEDFLVEIRKYYRNNEDDTIDIMVDKSMVNEIISHSKRIEETKKSAIKDRDKLLTMLSKTEKFFSSTLKPAYTYGKLSVNAAKVSTADNSFSKENDQKEVSESVSKTVSTYASYKSRQVNQIAAMINLVASERVNALKDQIKQERGILRKCLFGNANDKPSTTSTTATNESTIVTGNSVMEAASVNTNVFPIESTDKYDLLTINGHEANLLFNGTFGAIMGFFKSTLKGILGIAEGVLVANSQMFAIDVIGTNRDMLLNKSSFGPDNRLIAGAKIHAINSGEVITVDRGSTTGKHVIIRHSPLLYTLYAHMDKVNVKAKDMVRRGEVIGTVGDTGNSSQHHLHVQCCLFNPSFGAKFTLLTQVFPEIPGSLTSMPLSFSNIEGIKIGSNYATFNINCLNNLKDIGSWYDKRLMVNLDDIDLSRGFYIINTTKTKSVYESSVMPEVTEGIDYQMGFHGMRYDEVALESAILDSKYYDQMSYMILAQEAQFLASSLESGRIEPLTEADFGKLGGKIRNAVLNAYEALIKVFRDKAMKTRKKYEPWIKDVQRELLLEAEKAKLNMYEFWKTDYSVGIDKLKGMIQKSYSNKNYEDVSALDEFLPKGTTVENISSADINGTLKNFFRVGDAKSKIEPVELSGSALVSEVPKMIEYVLKYDSLVVSKLESLKTTLESSQKQFSVTEAFTGDTYLSLLDCKVCESDLRGCLDYNIVFGEPISEANDVKIGGNTPKPEGNNGAGVPKPANKEATEKEKETGDQSISSVKDANEDLEKDANGDGKKTAETKGNEKANAYKKAMDYFYKLALKAYTTAREEQFIAYTNAFVVIHGKGPKFDKNGTYVPEKRSTKEDENAEDNTKKEK